LTEKAAPTNGAAFFVSFTFFTIGIESPNDGKAAKLFILA
jgi:hypothetical protein